MLERTLADLRQTVSPVCHYDFTGRFVKFEEEASYVLFGVKGNSSPYKRVSK